MNPSSNIRVRFAPSPTGFLHVGGLRTALYNYLFARKSGGVFILRIEDTDRTRYVEGAIESLIKTMEWCGLEYDEGPLKGGPYGPYIQSERLDIYKHHVQILIDKKKAYYCFCEPQRIEELRRSQEKQNLQTKYDKHCLHLSEDDINIKLKSGSKFVVRLNVEPNKIIVVDDIIRGSVQFESNLLDDQILLKSDGYPTYHLANVVDDHLMQISHVIRGEEWLPSTPKHVLLYDSFGWQKPIFAHLPLLLNPDKSKLSKRQGDVAVEEYRAKGYLKEALINFVALLGWNPGTEQEYFSMDELKKQFSLESINKSGAIFNVEKLNWLNFEHLRNKSENDVLKLLKEELLRSRFKEIKLEDETLKKIIQAMRPRVTFIKEFLEKSSYFFEPPKEYEKEAVKKHWKSDIPDKLKILIEEFSKLEQPTKEDYETVLKNTAQKLNVSNGKIIHAVRLAISGVSGGPGLYDIIEILGKDETVKRLKDAIEQIKY